MCKKQQDVQKTIRCAKNNKMYKKRKTMYWGLINSNVNKRDVQSIVRVLYIEQQWWECENIYS